jgi:ABC-type branched-subunit amino acid transport system ATPase component
VLSTRRRANSAPAGRRPPRLSQAAGALELRAQSITVRFGNLVALEDVALELEQGEILGLIGPNGAGKTTLVNVLTGFQRRFEGRVFLGGIDVGRSRPEVLARMGLTRTFQGTRLFGELTVLENVQAAGAGRRIPPRAARKAAAALIERMELGAHAHARVSTLSQGHQQLVALLRALATRPAFLLLDEPAAGLGESEADQLRDVIRSLRDEFGCGVMIIDHDMTTIMTLCARVHVLDHGRTIAVGRPDVVQRDPRVIAAYLGSDRD